MKYVSTRRSNDQEVTFETALTSGYAPDRGLFVPSKLPPNFTEFDLKRYSSLRYAELAYEILRLFISSEEVPNTELQNICNKCFSQGWRDNNIVPVFKLPQNENETSPTKVPMFLAELFHGPTYCFKDLGLQFVVHLLGYFCTKRQMPMTLLVSTTGDTGPAAVGAVAGMGNPLLKLVVHFPYGQISEFQRRQLTTVNCDQVKVVAFEGGGDDMDIPIKNILTGSFLENRDNKETVDALKKSKQCGVNSYNIGRPIMQMVHFIWTYLRVAELEGIEIGDAEKPIDVVLPTGAMGNIAGGYIAKKMGLPIRFLCAGVNVNDITHRAIQQGQFHKSDGMIKTLSDAINIQLPYNFERLMYYMSDENPSLVRQWMTTVDETEKLTLESNWILKLQADFRSARVDDELMCATLLATKEKWNYVADPHTAVAFSAAEQLGYCSLTSKCISEELQHQKCSAVAVLSTASPCKFQESVSAALGPQGWKDYFEDGFPIEAKDLLNKPERDLIMFRKQSLNLEIAQSNWQVELQNIIASGIES